MFTLDRLSFAYPHQSTLFDGFSWQVADGEAWAVLGASGCGKTTLLYLLAGLLFPSGGQVMMGSQPLNRPRPQTGLILQDYGLLPWATVRQNIRLGQQIRAFYGPDGRHAPTGKPAEEAVDPWLGRLGLSAVSNQYPHQLSGGQRQRTAIARTLILQPDLLLMDEPFSSLDALTREDLQALTMDLWREQRFTFIVVTHAIEEAVRLGQRILVMGKPPHREAKVVDNPGWLAPAFSGTPAYQELCQSLRSELEEAKAVEKA